MGEINLLTLGKFIMILYPPQLKEGERLVSDVKPVFCQGPRQPYEAQEQARWAGHQGGIQVKGLPWGSRGEGKGCPQRANKGASPQGWQICARQPACSEEEQDRGRDYGDLGCGRPC